ncbi:MAG: STAS domain-containing protein, partial [Desulfobacca sp.]|uniref:STAS domain-containing protein n=1 Tax=Desulfobacca sp. TaxID=2067990 RepID=UPI00404AA203
IIEKTSNNDTLLKIQGRLDSLVLKDHKKNRQTLLQEGKIHLVFDMAEVSFMDSSGLGAILAALRAISQAGGDIRIASLQPRVRALFELTRLHQVFQIYGDVAAAVESY